MKLAVWTITFAFAIFSAPVLAQTVYKCTSKDGVKIFSSEPCGKDAKPTTYSAPTAEKEAERADVNCRRDANDLALKPNEAGIEAAKAELNSLGGSSTHGTPEENEAWRRRVQARMDTLQAYIRSEEQHNADQFVEAVKKREKAIAECDKKKAERQPASAPPPVDENAAAPVPADASPTGG